MPPVNERRVSFLGEFGGLGHRVDGHYWGDSDQGRAVGTKKGVFAYGGMKDTSTREGLEKTYLGLIEKLGGNVTKCVFLMELAGLKGREKLAGHGVECVITYPGK